MSLIVHTADGGVVEAVDGPTQLTEGGFDTGLASNSVPLANWTAGASYSRLYETQPWVAIAVNKLTRQVARLPLKVYERNSQGEKQRVQEGRLVDAIGKPQPRKSSIDFKQWMAFPSILHGNGTIRKLRDETGAPTSGFEPLELIHLQRPDEKNDFWVHRKPGERPRIILPQDILHTAWMPPTGFMGVSPLAQLGVTLRIDQAAQRYQEATFRNSARPSGAIQAPKEAKLDADMRAEIRSDIAKMQMGVDNAGRPVFLPNGFEWKAMSHTAQEAELINQRTLVREEVAAMYDVPPPMIGLLDHATYSNITEQHKMLFGPVLAPWLVLFEEQFKAQVIDGEYDGQFIEFDLKDVLRGDPVKEAIALKTELGNGLLTINEARAIQNRPPIKHPNADRPMVPTNNISFIGEEPAEQDGADDLAARTDEIEKALAQVSPDFAKSLNPKE